MLSYSLMLAKIFDSVSITVNTIVVLILNKMLTGQHNSPHPMEESIASIATAMN